MWMSRLRDAKSAQEALSIANDFVSQMTEVELDFLPEDCRPPRPMRSIGELDMYTERLLNYPPHGTNARLVLRMAELFTAVTRRIEELKSRQPR